MKRFKLYHKFVAIALTIAFVGQSMSELNEHTYTTGIDSYHYKLGCFGAFPSHLSVSCESNYYFH